MAPASTALITGAGGFCARELARLLAAEGRGAVVGLGRRPAPAHDERLTDYVKCDIGDAGGLARVVRRIRPSRVFHLAATSAGTRGAIFATNVAGTLHLLDAVRAEAPAAAVIVMGSAAEYGPVPRRSLPITEDQACRPQTPYAESKLAATQAALRFSDEHGVRAVVARPFNMIGAGMPSSLVLGSVVEQLRAAIAAGTRPAVVVTGRTDARRDFVRVEDVAEALVRMAGLEAWGQVFNLCTGIATPVKSLLEMLQGSIDWPVTFARRPGSTKAGPMESRGSHTRATSAFGFAPSTDLAGAIRNIVRVDLAQLQAVRP